MAVDFGSVKPVELGFIAREARTWDPALQRGPRVMVPIHVDALVVRDANLTWADTRFRSESTAPRSIDRLPPPFQNLDTPRPVGVHLHWAAPDALSRLRGSGQTLEPPALPDRWLVARLSPGVAGRRAVAAWVLDSRNATHTQLSQWTSTPATGKRVTVLGGGDAAWAAYYENVVDRFAFYDSLSDVAQGPIAYLVAGWYADDADDPLAAPGPRSVAEFEALLDQLRWGLSETDLERAQEISEARVERAAAAGLDSPQVARTSEGTLAWALPKVGLDRRGKPAGGTYRLAFAYGPEATLFHGSVVGLSWPSIDQSSPEIGGPPAPGDVRVAVGLTPAEALATVIAQTTGSEQDADLLTAFAHGALTDLGQPDGRTKLMDRIHDAGFDSRPTGSTEVTRTSHLPNKVRSPKEPVKTSGGARKQWQAFKETVSGEYRAVHGTLGGAVTSKPEPTKVMLPNPRVFLPTDPVVAIQGALRSPKHGGDGRYDSEGRLICRLSGSVVRALHVRVSGNERVGITALDVMDGQLAQGGLPPECQDLLDEVALLDPGGSESIAGAARARAGSESMDAATVNRIAQTEQTAWWAVRDPKIDAHAVLSYSGIDGTLPSPIAIRPADKPWIPLHVDWEVEYLATPIDAFTPGEIDFEPGAVPQASGPHFSGRSLLSPGVATALADALRAYTQHVEHTDTSSEQPTSIALLATQLLDAADPETQSLDDLADRLATLDIISGSLEHFHLRLRAGVLPDPATPAPDAPSGFVGLRSGFLRVVRLRLVDAFGQLVDLAGSGASASVDPARITVSDELRVDASPGVLALAPRFTAPTRVQFRFVNAQDPTHETTLDSGPICGWLLPDHLDESLEVFDASANPLGSLRLDPDYGSVWEPAPGLPAAFGEAPKDRIQSPVLSGMAQALFELGMDDLRRANDLGATEPNQREPALSALLRVIDSTRWSVDPFAHTGEEHLALLIGHPVAVVLATLRLEVQEPANGAGIDQVRVPVRLGALTHWKDGLFGFFVDDEYRRCRCARAAAELARPPARAGFLQAIDDVPGYWNQFSADIAAGGSTPVINPYLDPSGLLWVVPGITYRLTLLLEPNCSVHATAGLVPRKDLALRREWMTPVLSKLAPTFRFGPVLRDPKKLRMPIPADLGGAWTWTHRADVDRWADDEDVVHIGQDAMISADPAVAEEGWLRFSPAQEKKNG